MFGAIVFFVSAMVFGNASAQPNLPTTPQIRRIALKSGETAELGNVFFVVNCKSIMIGSPVVEILEGPPELTVTIRPGMVVPRALGCTNEVSGGALIVAATEVDKAKTARLVFRVKYKTRDGDRQVANTYAVELFP
jgi:ribosomal protein L21